MPHNPAVLRAGATLARTIRSHGTPAEVAKARTALEEAKVRAWVERTLADAPPHLSKATVAKLTRLLTPEAGEQR